MKLGVAVQGERKFIAADVDGQIVDLSEHVGTPDLMRVIRDWDHWRPILRDAIATADRVVADAAWTSPLPHPP